MKEYPSSLGGLSLQCILPIFQSSTNRLTKVLPNGNLTCSQVYDNGTNVGIGTTSPTYKLSVNGPVHSTANIFISDKKFKRNITKIENPLETILKLNGKKYNWRVDEFKEFDFTSRKQIGFIAQEVKEIIPEIVYVDDKGEHSMNYTALIPLLVEAIKEQQNQIMLLQNKISDVEQATSDSGIILEDKTSFSTNYPNPFSTSTTVDYFIMKNVNTAKIIVYDSNGATINTFNLNERGRKSQLVINKKNIQSGIYFYTLITDNVVIGTKKMIVK
ncbi:tail fiber domain-containing protein [Flavobacteriaceae bacterium]|nr:tail fiber domain-containing protein [Flavobacteriaceae bacterium]